MKHRSKRKTHDFISKRNIFVVISLSTIFLFFTLKWFSSYKAEFRLAVSLEQSCPYSIAEEKYCRSAIRADENACETLWEFCSCSCCEEPDSCKDTDCSKNSKECPCTCAPKPCTNENNHAEWCKLEDLPFCDAWAQDGGCQSRPDYMLDCCRASCGLCPNLNPSSSSPKDMVTPLNGVTRLKDMNFLTIPQPFWKLNSDGIFDISHKYSFLSVDIGYNRGHITGKWLESQNELFVIAFEANPQMYAYHKVIQWDLVTDGQSFASQFCQNLTSTATKDLKRAHLRNYNLFAIKNAKLFDERIMLINAAAGAPNTKGVAEFFLRKSDSTGDSGTLRKFDDQISQVTIILPVSSILAKLPTRLQYDTLKVDALGAELQVLKGVGNHIMKFKCVIGEFGTIPREPGAEESKKHLKEYGFVSVPPYLWGEGAETATDLHKNDEYEKRIYSVERFDNRFFINTAFVDEFIRGEDYWCRVADVTRKRYGIEQLRFRAQWFKDKGF